MFSDGKVFASGEGKIKSGTGRDGKMKDGTRREGKMKRGAS
jgi:hypothetical protein